MSLPSLDLSTGGRDFINDSQIEELLSRPEPTAQEVRDIIQKSLSKEPLTLAETASLLNTRDPELVNEIFEAARTLKRTVYGNRIVLFAPFYIGNKCINDCKYCSFRSSNKDQIRRTLTPEEIEAQVRKLESVGHKRLIIVFGESPVYDADFIAGCVRQIYSIKEGHGGEIRRLNVNAAPMDIAGYKKIKAAGIGTYQIFQETYHHATYEKWHNPQNRKGNYLYRLDGLSRALEAGCDDVGIGALFGLYDWRFETMGLVAHAIELKNRFGVGPHTISFPRIQPAQDIHPDPQYKVSDDQFLRLVATLRLAVPYTGLIMTARESPAVRRKVMEFGVSQIDAGSRVEIGGYTEGGPEQAAEREQFQLGDIRSLDEVIRDLLENGFLPSFCTACYRLGRTGEHFMEFAIPGFIKRYCTPNAISTLQEYLADYASAETKAAGVVAIKRELDAMEDGPMKERLKEKLAEIANGDLHDLYF